MSTARSPFAAARQLVVVLHPGIKVGAVMDVDVDATVQQLEIVAHHAILIHGLPYRSLNGIGAAEASSGLS